MIYHSGLGSREVQSTLRILFHNSFARHLVDAGTKSVTASNSLRWHGTDIAYTEINTNIIADAMRCYLNDAKTRLTRLWPSTPVYVAGVINYLTDLLCEPLLCLTCDGRPSVAVGRCPACGRAAQEVPPPSPTAFTCSACTFINQIKSGAVKQVCDMCGTPHTSPPPSAAPAPVAAVVAAKPVIAPVCITFSFSLFVFH